MTFAETLRRIRTDHRMSQSELARAAGLEHSSISRIESGRRNPSRSMAEQLVAALRATPDERYQLLTSAGFHCDITVEADLLTLNACLSDETIDPDYQNALRDTIRSLIVLAEWERGSARPRSRSVVALRRVS